MSAVEGHTDLYSLTENGRLFPFIIVGVEWGRGVPPYSLTQSPRFGGGGGGGGGGAGGGGEGP
jgi:hypothetical protein